MKKLFLAMAIAIVTATAVPAQENDKEDRIVIPVAQTDKHGGYDSHSVIRCGIKFNSRLSDVTKVELKSVDGNLLAGTASLKKNARGKPMVDNIENASSIITFSLVLKIDRQPIAEWFREQFEKLR